MAVFALIAEAGVLEAQALLLVESIRLFAGAHSDTPIIVISPRKDRRPSAQTIARLETLSATYLEYNISSVAPHYGTTFRVHASARLERESREDVIVFLDSDIFFAGEPSLDLGDCAFAARPEDVKGMCTTGPDDPKDVYWQLLCKVCDVDYDALPYITTPVDQVRVKATYNGGFVAAKRSAEIFQRTEDFLVRSIAAGVRPTWPANFQVRAAHDLVRGRGAKMWGSSQACLSLAAWGVGKTVKELPLSHNFPAHMKNYVATHGMREPMVAVHYHHLFNAPHTPVHRRLRIPASCAAWLDKGLPIHGA